MKKNILLSLLSVFFLGSVNSQQIFQRTYYGDNNGQGNSMQQTTDGGFIIAGNYASGGKSYATLLKADTNGITSWSKTYFNGEGEGFMSVKQTMDGGYIAAGFSYSCDSVNGDIFLVKTDANGNTVWAKCYGGASYDNANSVKQTTDGGFVITGYTQSFGSGGRDAYLIKTDANGDTLWTKTFGTNYQETGTDVQQTIDGGYIITGNAYYNFNSGAYLIKTDANGDSLWTKIFTTQNSSNYLSGTAILQTLDSGYMVLGSPEYSFLFENLVLIKTDATGDTLWTKQYYGYEQYYYSFAQTSDGGYIICGNVDGTGIEGDKLILVKINASGDTLWTKQYDGHGYWVYGNEALQTNDGGYALVGTCGQGIAMIKTDNNGSTTCGDMGSLDFFNQTYSPININSGATLGSGAVVQNVSIITGIPDSSIANPCLPIPDICVVTVDSATQKNMIIWNKDIDTTFVDSYNIYKETTDANVYALIGNVSNGNFSTFIDYASTPAQKADRYKISTVDSLGIESYAKSNAHKTVHLSVNLGNPPQINLNWDAYAGFNVSKYRIWRGNGNGVTLIDSIQGNLFSYTDLNPPANDTIYYVEALHPTGCNPTFAKSNGYSSTKSNHAIISKPAGFPEIAKNNFVSIFPNPSNGKFSIKGNNNIISIEIYNLLGEKIYNSLILISNNSVIDLSNQSNGIYFVKIKSEENIYYQKLLKQ